jgi:acetyl esterase/lipase
MSYTFETVYFDKPIVTNRSIDIFMPTTVTRDIAIFFVHGGGWFGGTKTCYHKIMEAFNQVGFICGSVDYRLGGKDTQITDQITDIRHGYDIFTGLLKKHNRPLKIFVHGSSAGAHLSGLLALAAPGECGEDAEFNGFIRQHEWVKPVGYASQSTPTKFEPWEDIFPPILDCIQRIVGKPYLGNENYYHKFALETYLNSNNCPTFFLAAANEHMFPIEHAEAFILQLNQLGGRGKFKIYANTEHGFFYDLTRRQQKEAFQDIIDFIESL